MVQYVLLPHHPQLKNIYQPHFSFWRLRYSPPQQQVDYQCRGGSLSRLFLSRGIFFTRALELRHPLNTILQAVRSNLQEALRVAAGNGSEEDKLEARIEADVYEALQHALGA